MPATPFSGDILATIEIILNGVLHLSGFRKVFDALTGIDNPCRLCEPPPATRTSVIGTLLRRTVRSAASRRAYARPSMIAR